MNWSILYVVLATVESANNPKAVEDSGKAVGLYQIHEIFVDEVNRIKDMTLPGSVYKFTYEDRWDKQKCEQMIHTYVRYWCGRRGQPIAYENACRMFNAGPDWLWETELTDGYWARCLEVLGPLEQAQAQEAADAVQYILDPEFYKGGSVTGIRQNGSGWDFIVYNGPEKYTVPAVPVKKEDS